MAIIPEVQKKQRSKIEFQNLQKTLSDARDEIIDLFEKRTFPFKGNVFKTKEEESEENKLEKIKDDYEKFFEYIEDE